MILFVPVAYLATANAVTTPVMNKTPGHSPTGRRIASEEHLMQEAERARADAATLSPGHARDALLRKARQSETAAHMNDWIDSPGLKPPD